MLDIIFSLLLMLGVDLYSAEDNIVVINSTTGETFGLGNTANIGNRPPEETSTYILYKDSDGNYYLVKK
jgi:hypothetical protein